MNLTDEKLVENFLEGDDLALQFLVDRYLKPLYNFVFQLTGDSAACEDIVQETFLKMWKNLEKYDCQKKFSTWLFAIAKNTAFDWLKKRKTFAFSSFENEDGESFLENIADENILSVDALLAKMDDSKNLQELFEDLSPQIRSMLLLHHEYGFSLVEIASIMNSSPNTIKSRYRRTLLDLRQRFSEKILYIKQKSAVETD